MTAILVSPTGGVPGTSVANAGRARAKGFETEFTYLLADNWSIAGSYAYIDSEVTEKKEGGVSVPSNELPLPRYIPENQWSLVLNYDQEFSAFKLTGTATYTWIDEILGNDKSVTSLYQDSGGNLTMEQARSAVDAYASDAYGLLSLNLMVSPLDDRYSVSLWCKNVLDERKISSTNSQITGSTYQYVSGRYTEPRMWGVTLTANF
jgi:outer membrane receptor protein involved in Fe transport